MENQNNPLQKNLSKELFFDLFDRSSIAMALTDIISSKYHAINKTFQTYTGYKKIEEIDISILGINLVDPINRDNYKMILERKGYVNNFESAIRKKNGELFWSSTSIQIIELDHTKYLLTSLSDITYQKQTEEHVGHLQAIIQSSKDAFISESLDGNIKSWNKGAEQMFGFTPKQAIGSHFSIIIPSNYLKEESKILKQTLKTKISNQFDTVRIKKDGNEFYVSLTISPLKDKVGNIIGVSKIVRDITSIKKSEEELLNANEELAYQHVEKEKRAAELGIANLELAYQDKEKGKRAAELGIANIELAFQDKEKGKRAAELGIANIELVFQDEEKEKRAAELIIANEELVFQNNEKEKRAAELIIANEELVYQNEEKEKRAAELIIANKELIFQNNEKEKRAAELGIANKELIFQNEEKEKRAAELIIANKELVFQNEEKEKRAVELLIANKELVFQNREKEKRAAELVIADIELNFQIKEKEKREIANKELEAFSYKVKLASQYSLSLIEASRDPLFTISPLGKITDMNNATLRITGTSRKKLIGNDFIDYFTNPENARECYNQVFEKGFIVDYPLTVLDNKLTDVLCNGSVYKDDKNNVVGVVIVARDITEQKRFEKELMEAKEFAELSTKIAEEAKAKAESATIIAENAVKAKQQFLSNMSHEIRTPMNAIIGFTKVVLKTELTPKQNEYLSAIKMSGDALVVLINDILDLAKVDAGKMIFEKIPFQIALSISAMIHVFDSKIQEKNLLLLTEFDSRIPAVLVGDPVRLHQIILNLMSNAVKFTTIGKIIVSVQLIKETSEEITIKFAVTDTGIGIAANKIDQIFENFQQATSSTSRIFGGTGLGLAIVKQLVESQDGTIQVSSTLNEGSTFSFTLSFQKTNATAKPDLPIEVLESEIKDIRVLVVEDIALNQLLMKTLLDDFGFSLDIAENGLLAIEKLKTKLYDIILMDLQMPVMNGFEATDHIRNTMHLKIPIIALTADVTTVDLKKCKEVGMNDYIAKPVDERVLYAKIVSLVKKPLLTNTENFDVETINSTQNKEIAMEKCTNLTFLNARTKSDPTLMMTMISLYIEQTIPLLSILKQSMLEKEWETMKLAAHKMIPSFAIVGIDTRFENIARRIQLHIGNEEPTEELKNMILQLETVCLQACSELEEEFIKIKSN